MFGQTRSTSFSFGQGPAKQPAFGNNAPGGSGAQATFSFGQPSASAASSTSAAPASTGLFGSTTGQQPAAGGGLFGAQQPQQQQQPAAGGLSFGAGAAAKPLFGQSTTQQPQQSGGLFSFGQPAQQQSQQQQQPQTQGTGLICGTPFVNAQAGQQQAGTGGGLFSFGQKPPGTQTQQPAFQLGQSTLGQSTLGQSTLGQSLFGQSQLGQSQQAQQTQQGQQLSTPFAQHPFYQKEKYNDLPPAAKQMVDSLDSYIQAQIKLRDELKAADLGAEASKSSQGVWQIQTELKSLAMVIEGDLLVTQDLQERAEADRADSNTLFEVARNFYQGSDNEHLKLFPRRYFARAAADFGERVRRYRATIEGIERQLSSIEHRDEYSPQAIESAIQAQNATFMALASQVASVHASIDQLKEDFTRWYQEQHQTARDPFTVQHPGASVLSA